MLFICPSVIFIETAELQDISCDTFAEFFGQNSLLGYGLDD